MEQILCVFFADLHRCLNSRSHILLGCASMVVKTAESGAFCCTETQGRLRCCQTFELAHISHFSAALQNYSFGASCSCSSLHNSGPEVLIFPLGQALLSSSAQPPQCSADGMRTDTEVWAGGGFGTQNSLQQLRAEVRLSWEFGASVVWLQVDSCRLASLGV